MYFCDNKKDSAKPRSICFWVLVGTARVGLGSGLGLVVVITSYPSPASWQRDQNLLKAGRGVRGVAGVPVRKSGIGKFNPNGSQIKVGLILGNQKRKSLLTEVLNKKCKMI